MYGVKQSAKSWNQTIHDVLIKSKIVQSKFEPCFYIHSERALLAFVLIYVDDILISSKEESTIVKVKNIFKTAFEIRDLGPIKYYLLSGNKLLKKWLFFNFSI